MRQAAYLAILIVTFASGCSGLSYRGFASKMGWQFGSAWGKPLVNFLSFAAMLIGIAEAWAAYGIFIAVIVGVAGFCSAFTLTLVLKKRIQILNAIGITVGSLFSLLGPTVFS